MKLLFPCPWTGNSIKPKRRKREVWERWSLLTYENHFTKRQGQQTTGSYQRLLSSHGGAGWEIVFLCCLSIFSCPWKNFGSVIGWNASLTICTLFLQNINEERKPHPPQRKQARGLHTWCCRSAQGSTVLSWSCWAPDHQDKRFLRLSLWSLSIPSTHPLLCSAHSITNCQILVGLFLLQVSSSTRHHYLRNT